VRFVLGWMVALGVASCATTPPAVLDAEANRGLDAAERALEAEDPAKARDELEKVLARRPRAGTAHRAQALDRELAARELEPFEPAFRQIAECLERRDDELARRVLELVYARGPVGAARRHADAFSRIVDGRALAGAVALELEAEPLEKKGEYRLVLVASHPLAERVVVRCPAAGLEFFCLGVNENGIEQRIQKRVVVDALEKLAIDAGETKRVPLGTFYVPVGGMVGARAEWRLEAVGGVLARGAAELPANRIDAASCEVVRLDPRLPEAPVEPAELVGYLESGGDSVAALVECAVRIEPERRGEALDALAARLVPRPDADLRFALPALRWLSGVRDAAEDEATWRARLAARTAPAAAAARPALDLPAASGPSLRGDE
jgi:hypothetical protein